MKSAENYASEMADCTVGYGADAFYDVSVDIEKLREIALQIQRDALLHAAEIASKWSKSKSCDHHDTDPCCHVRTGDAIERAIRAEADKLKGAK